MVVGEPQAFSPKSSYPAGEPVGHGSVYLYDAMKSATPIATIHPNDWAGDTGYGKQVAASENGNLTSRGRAQC